MRKHPTGLVPWLMVAAVSGLTSFSHAQARPSWGRIGTMPFERAEVAATEIDGHIYVVGGESRGVDANAFNWEYDLLGGVWRELAVMPSVASHAGAAALSGKMYVVGGFAAGAHGGAVGRVFEFDPAANTWRARTPLSSPRGASGVVAFNGRIHVIGGRDGSGKTVASHGIYDPGTDTWSEGAPLPLARDHVGIAAIAGRIHVVGGRLDTSVDNTGRHDVYDPATNTWSQAAPLPTPRSGGVAFVLRNRIVYAGGECKNAGSGETFPDVDAFDPNTNTWEVLPSMTQRRHAAAAVTTEREAYVIGGNRGCGASDPTSDLLVLRWP